MRKNIYNVLLRYVLCFAAAAYIPLPNRIFQLFVFKGFGFGRLDCASRAGTEFYKGPLLIMSAFDYVGFDYVGECSCNGLALPSIFDVQGDPCLLHCPRVTSAQNVLDEFIRSHKIELGGHDHFNIVFWGVGKQRYRESGPGSLNRSPFSCERLASAEFLVVVFKLCFICWNIACYTQCLRLMSAGL